MCVGGNVLCLVCVCVYHTSGRDEGVEGKNGSGITKVLACQQDRGKLLLRTLEPNLRDQDFDVF